MSVTLVLAGGPGDRQTIHYPQNTPPPIVEYVTGAGRVEYRAAGRNGVAYRYTPARLIDRVTTPPAADPPATDPPAPPRPANAARKKAAPRRKAPAQ